MVFMKSTLFLFAGILMTLSWVSCASKDPVKREQAAYSSKLKSTLESNKSKISECYHAIAKKKKIPAKKGKVVYKIEIDPMGKLLEVSPVKERSDFTDERADICVRESLLEARFPKNKVPDPDGGSEPKPDTQIFYPFNF